MIRHHNAGKDPKIDSTVFEDNRGESDSTVFRNNRRDSDSSVSCDNCRDSDSTVFRDNPRSSDSTVSGANGRPKEGAASSKADRNFDRMFEDVSSGRAQERQKEKSATKPSKSAQIIVKPSFHDVDAMGVVWHGNYLKYFERAREELFASLGYGYREMRESGYAWPIIEIRVKYRKPAVLEMPIAVTAFIKEFENELKIEYEAKDLASGKLLTWAMTRQMAFDLKTRQGQLVSPKVLFDVLQEPCPYA